MRWELLFNDLESQLERGLAEEHDDVARDDERLRLARLGIGDRVRAVTGRSVAVTLRSGVRVALTVEQVGRDWVCGEADAAGDTLVMPFWGVASIGMPLALARDSIAPAAGRAQLVERLGVAFVLRDLARRRRTVELTIGSGTVHGTIDRVGRDHLDVAEHEPGELRRDRIVRRSCLVPLAALECVRVRPE